MRILVAQQTRMGDMLQTSPLIHSLKLKHPDAHIAALVRRMSKVVAERHPDIDDVIVYDEEPMFRDMCADDSDALLRAYRAAEAQIAAVAEGGYDIVYNCTHSIASAMLLKLADIPRVVGAHLSDEWRYVLRGRWITYFYTSIFQREYNALNLCDIVRHFAEDAPACRELLFEVRDDDRAFVERLFVEHGIAQGDYVVCMQLGASEPSKRWPAEQFAALARRLHAEHGARILLLGVEGEAPLGAAFEAAAPGIAIPLFGKTSISQLAAVLERATCLVTNDTGTMHVAAAVKCPTVLVSVGWVHFRETGPYGAGHCALERTREVLGESGSRAANEMNQIEPRHVVAALSWMQSRRAGMAFRPSQEEIDERGVTLFVSDFAPDGCLEWYPAMPLPLTRDSYLRAAYRTMWLHFLAGRASETTERESLERLFACYMEGPTVDVEDWCKEASASFAALRVLALRGVDMTRRLLVLMAGANGYAEAREPVAKLMQLDEETRVFGEVQAEVKPLVMIARYERDNLEGMDPVLLAQETLLIYEDMQARAELMQEKLVLAADVWRARDKASARVSANG